MRGRRDAATMQIIAFGLALLWALALLAPGAVLPVAFLVLPALRLLPASASARRGTWLGIGLLAIGGGGALAAAAHPYEGLAWGGALLLLQRWYQDQGVRLATLERASHCDALTGAFNRHRLPRLEAELGMAGGVLSYLDIDGFKALNRARGQGAGDAALRRLAEALGSAPVVRMGGDEFLVLYAEVGPEAAEHRLRAVLTDLTDDGLSFCAGLAPLRAPLASALAEADEALRRAKALGPGQLCWGNARAC